MPRRKEYPLDIELKIPDEVSDRGFNTESQQDAAHILQTHWKGEFLELSKEHDEFSRGMYQKVYQRYFGPIESEKTFAEIYSEYDSLDEWRQATRLQEAAAQAGLGELDEEKLKIFKEGVRFGVELEIQREDIRRDLQN